MNSREKGKRGERQWRDELRAQGYAARRGQQSAVRLIGFPSPPPVSCPRRAVRCRESWSPDVRRKCCEQPPKR